MSSEFFLLLKEAFATCTDNNQFSSVPVAAGHLWFSSSSTNKQIKSCETSNLSITFQKSIFEKINEAEFNLLFPIQSFTDRINIAAEKNFFKNCVKIFELFKRLPSIEVYALISSFSDGLDEGYGLVRYIGPLPQLRGYWFGIELPFAYEGLGSCDGSVEGEKLFECQKNCGLFISLDKIISFHINDVDGVFESAASSPTFDEDTRNNNYRDLQDDLPLPEIDLGDRVVWLSDQGPELGTVKWIGILPDARIREYNIGVEFDRPIGTGTGKYLNKQLFRTLQNHASIIPAIGLLKAIEFYGDSVPSAPPHLTEFNLLNQQMSKIKESKIPQKAIFSANKTPTQNATPDALKTLRNTPIETKVEILHKTPDKSLGSTKPDRSAKLPANKPSKLDGVERSNEDASIKEIEQISVKDDTDLLNKLKTPTSTNAPINITKSIDNQASYSSVKKQSKIGFTSEAEVINHKNNIHRSYDDIYVEKFKPVSTIHHAFQRTPQHTTINNNNNSNEIYSFLKGNKVVDSKKMYAPKSFIDEKFNTIPNHSGFCKVFDDNDVTLRLPYATGRSTFYGKANGFSIIEAEKERNNLKTASRTPSFLSSQASLPQKPKLPPPPTFTSKQALATKQVITTATKESTETAILTANTQTIPAHPAGIKSSFLKFITRRNPSSFLHHINKTIKSTFTPSSLHRRSSIENTSEPKLAIEAVRKSFDSCDIEALSTNNEKGSDQSKKGANQIFSPKRVVEQVTSAIQTDDVIDEELKHKHTDTTLKDSSTQYKPPTPPHKQVTFNEATTVSNNKQPISQIKTSKTQPITSRADSKNIQTHKYRKKNDENFHILSPAKESAVNEAFSPSSEHATIYEEEEEEEVEKAENKKTDANNNGVIVPIDTTDHSLISSTDFSDCLNSFLHNFTSSPSHPQSTQNHTPKKFPVTESDAAQSSINNKSVSIKSDVDVGSVVGVSLEGRMHRGTVRWMGCFKDNCHVIAGLELDGEVTNGSDGKIGSRRFFTCSSGKAIFTSVKNLNKYPSMHKTASKVKEHNLPLSFINMKELLNFLEQDQKVIHPVTPPPPPPLPPLLSPNYKPCPIHSQPLPQQFKAQQLHDKPSLESLISPSSPLHHSNHLYEIFKMQPPPPQSPSTQIFKGKGVESTVHGCSLENIIFSMFAFTNVFDSLLHRNLFNHVGGRRKTDEENLTFLKLELQSFLRDSIVFNLRRRMYVGRENTMLLKALLHRMCPQHSFNILPKGPDDVLGVILEDVFNEDPYLKFSSEQQSYVYHLSIDPTTTTSATSPFSTQFLMELSFFQDNIKLISTPSVLLLRVEREEGIQISIMPSLHLDITDVLLYGIRDCTICGSVASWECRQCLANTLSSLSSSPSSSLSPILNTIVFCHACSLQYHSHTHRSHHQPQQIKCPISRSSGVGSVSLRSKTGSSSGGSGVSGGNQKSTLMTTFSPTTDTTLTTSTDHLTLGHFKEGMQLTSVLCSSPQGFSSFHKTGPSCHSPWVYCHPSNSEHTASIEPCGMLSDILNNAHKQPNGDFSCVPLLETLLNTSCLFFYHSLDLLYYQ